MRVLRPTVQKSIASMLLCSFFFPVLLPWVETPFSVSTAFAYDEKASKVQSETSPATVVLVVSEDAQKALEKPIVLRSDLFDFVTQTEPADFRQGTGSVVAGIVSLLSGSGEGLADPVLERFAPVTPQNRARLGRFIELQEEQRQKLFATAAQKVVDNKNAQLLAEVLSDRSFSSVERRQWVIQRLKDM